MANLTALVTIVNEMFDVIDALITNMVDLMTGNLIVLIIVGAFIGLIVGIVGYLLVYIRKTFGNAVPSTKMK